MRNWFSFLIVGILSFLLGVGGTWAVHSRSMLAAIESAQFEPAISATVEREAADPFDAKRRDGNQNMTLAVLGCWSSGRGDILRITENKMFLSVNSFRPVSYETAAGEAKSDKVIIRLLDRPQFYFFQDYLLLSLDELEKETFLSIRDAKSLNVLDGPATSRSGWVRDETGESCAVRLNKNPNPQSYRGCWSGMRGGRLRITSEKIEDLNTGEDAGFTERNPAIKERTGLETGEEYVLETNRDFPQSFLSKVNVLSYLSDGTVGISTYDSYEGYFKDELVGQGLFEKIDCRKLVNRRGR